MTAIRQLSAQTPIVETGAVRFGDDYAGVFVRGTHAWLYLRAVSAGIDYLTCARGEEIHTEILRNLHDLLKSCIEHSSTDDPTEDRAA